jgi:hypothetical protein
MNDTLRGHSSVTFDDDTSPEGPDDVVEIPLLLSADQASALESAAYRRGLTAGGMVRRLLSDFISTTECHRGAGHSERKQSASRWAVCFLLAVSGGVRRAGSVSDRRGKPGASATGVNHAEALLRSLTLPARQTPAPPPAILFGCVALAGPLR